MDSTQQKLYNYFKEVGPLYFFAWLDQNPHPETANIVDKILAMEKANLDSTIIVR